MPLDTSLPNQKGFAQGTWRPAPQAHIYEPPASGGNGIVHVWVCLGRNNKIVDRVVVKNSFPGLRAFSDPIEWTDGVVGAEPMESSVANRLHARLRMNNAGDEVFVAECLGWGDIRGPPPYPNGLPQVKLYYGVYAVPRSISVDTPSSLSKDNGKSAL
ncbi:hypothetical protein E4T47_02456 [Aureobasidium subglaciale]|nr:hypothetical protein E4T43_02471 [Aureobasidium subglaciale]KAI5274536.1 hypothetical protein E4T47_02456 [Aureobasidium subglaciale]